MFRQKRTSRRARHQTKEELSGPGRDRRVCCARVLQKWRCTFLLSVFLLVPPIVLADDNGSKLPEGPGKTTVQKVCGGCHPPEIVLTHRDTKDGWTQVVTNMVDKGANGTDDEFNTVIDYLATHLPKKSGSNP